MQHIWTRPISQLDNWSDFIASSLSNLIPLKLYLQLTWMQNGLFSLRENNIHWCLVGSKTSEIHAWFPSMHLPCALLKTMCMQMLLWQLLKETCNCSHYLQDKSKLLKLTSAMSSAKLFTLRNIIPPPAHNLIFSNPVGSSLLAKLLAPCHTACLCLLYHPLPETGLPHAQEFPPHWRKSIFCFQTDFQTILPNQGNCCSFLQFSR